MSRLFESTLTAKISDALIKEKNLKEGYCPRCGIAMQGYPATSRFDDKTEICSDCGTDEAMMNFTGMDLYDPNRFDSKTGKKLDGKPNDNDIAGDSEEDLEDIKEAALPQEPPTQGKNERIADFIIDYDVFEFRNVYNGDNDEERRTQLIDDIEKDPEAAKKYVQDIANDDDRPEWRDQAEQILKLFESNTVKDKDKIEDRIAEIKVAIQDGVSEDEKKAMEKEIAELEQQLNESNAGTETMDEIKLHLEDIKSILDTEGSIDTELLKSKIEELIKLSDEHKQLTNESTLTEDSYEKGIFKEIEDALTDAGFDITRFIDSGTLTYNIGWDVSKNGESTQLNCNGTYYSDDDEEDEEYDESAKLKEAHRVDDGQYPPYRFDSEDAKFIQDLLGSGFKVEISKSASDEVEGGEIEIKLNTPYMSGFMSTTRDLDNEIDKYFAERCPEAEVIRNNTGTIIWLGDKKKKEINEGVRENSKYSDRLGGNPSDFIRDVKEIKAKLDEINVDGFGSKLAYEMVESFSDTCDSQIRMAQDRFGIKESVNVVTSDGSTVDTNDGASVTSNDGNVTVVTTDGTTVSINSTPEEPVMDVPMEEPTEEVPEEPINDISNEEPVEGETEVEVPEEPVEDEEELTEDGSADGNLKDYSVTVKERYGDEIVTFDVKAANKRDALRESKNKLVNDIGLMIEDICPTEESNNGFPKKFEVTQSINGKKFRCEVNANNDSTALDRATNRILSWMEYIIKEKDSDLDESTTGEDDEQEIESIDAKSMDIVKNQGNTFMIKIKTNDGKETYWVCEDYNQETKEGNNATSYEDKTEADKDYFQRVGLGVDEAIKS